MRTKTFAFRLAEAMAAEGLTQQELAERVEASQTTVSRWLANSAPRKQAAVKLAKALDVDLDWLLYGRGERRSYGGFANLQTAISRKKHKGLSEAEMLREARRVMQEVEMGFPSRLRWIRSNYGITLAEFAKNCGYTPGYFSRLENAGRKRPSWQFIESIITAYPEINRDWLWYGDGAPLNANNAKRGEFYQGLNTDQLVERINEAASVAQLKQIIARAADFSVPGNERNAFKNLLFFVEWIKKSSLNPNMRARLERITSELLLKLAGKL